MRWHLTASRLSPPSALRTALFGCTTRTETTRSPPKETLPRRRSLRMDAISTSLRPTAKRTARNCGSKNWTAEKRRRSCRITRCRSYSVSRDGKEVAFAMKDQSGHTNLWIAPTSRRSSPVRISSAAVEDSPFFPARRRPRLSRDRRRLELSLSHENRWHRPPQDCPGAHCGYQLRVTRWPLGCCRRAGVRARAHAGSKGVRPGWKREGDAVRHYCQLNWDTSGKFAFLNFPDLRGGSYALPVMRDSGLPKIPLTETPRIEDFPNPKAITAIPMVCGVGRESFGLRLHAAEYPPQPIPHPNTLRLAKCKHDS